MKQIKLILISSTQGLSYEVTGPMFTYLASSLDSTQFQISWALSARGLGMVLGALIGWLMCQKCPDWRDLWMTFGLMLSAISSASTPWCPQLLYLGGALGCMGIAKGLILTGTPTPMPMKMFISKVHISIFIIQY